MVLLGRPLQAQVEIDVTYKKKKHPASRYKVARPVSFTLVVEDQTYEVTPEGDDLKKWKIRSNGAVAKALYYSDPTKGIWWEISSVDQTTIVLLSPSPTDTNDPREFTITSSVDRGKFMVFNDEPDCNSEFTLIEPADSPTLPTGVMRTYGTMASDAPCDKGKWSVNFENKPPDHILIAFIFSTIQSTNVRFMHE